ncbi:hypothetical protein PR048_006959 [Dryococelus australis]|uniref:N-acetyltransferase domain-containing protein n=1 Tax=Dryococelus australis TaxID=614101 RepID=A0ABQ9ICE1_9NEOP|nr:hypothetical protein PR048_006959 [Dryococelus australis]
MQGRGNGRSSRKPVEQRHRPARFPLAKIWLWPGRGSNPVRLGRRREVDISIPSGRYPQRKFGQQGRFERELKYSGLSLDDILGPSSWPWSAASCDSLPLRFWGFKSHDNRSAAQKFSRSSTQIYVTEAVNDDSSELYRRRNVGFEGQTPVYLELFSAFEAERRGSVKGDTTRRIKCAIAATFKALNWRAVFSSCCVYLWDFQRRPYYFIGGKCIGSCAELLELFDIVCVVPVVVASGARITACSLRTEFRKSRLARKVYASVNRLLDRKHVTYVPAGVWTTPDMQTAPFVARGDRSCSGRPGGGLHEFFCQQILRHCLIENSTLQHRGCFV